MSSELTERRRPRRRRRQSSSAYRIIPSSMIIFYAIGVLSILVSSPPYYLLVQDHFVVGVEAWTANSNNQNHDMRFSRRRFSIRSSSSPLLMATMFPSTAEKKKKKKKNIGLFPSSSSSEKKNIHETMPMTKRSDNNKKSPASILFTAIVAATFFACSTTVLPAVATAANDNYNNNNNNNNAFVTTTRSLSSSSASSMTVSSSLESLTTLNSNSYSNTMEQDLVKTLKAPTADQPQIPFPGTTRAREAAATTSTTQSKKKKIAKTASSKNQQFIVPVQLSIEKSSSLPSQQERPYNGADVLVLQVLTDRPPLSDVSSSSALVVSESSSLSTKILGGAQIPIGAIGSNFPVRFSLGPLNSVVGQEDEWKAFSSSKDLWLRASICRDTDNDNPETINTNSAATASSSSSLAPCPISKTPILEGIGFSKWINFSNIQQQQQQQQDGGDSSADSKSGNDKIGIRAPATVILTTTVTATGVSSTK
ncbi:chitinase-like protein [Fragilariopsis cylindrus CCMP1102]|uniref:Chitinase-like protein n=1 Tax=Fragilariopsis cylindrus CCMP1102 TaxID=635003 RepID=A0A1E7EM48_9STRA|nr:chitinase-like protein [Fragilariopsis cylindrus CCMP1102]|eukprot:OEU06643.1 chitinase-like protein [Fragilariopsis cylindrus CCMP1102]